MRNEALLERLTQAWGVSGFENEVRAIVKEEAAPYADEILEDAIGNVIVLKKGRGGADAKKLMLAAHTDEIGFMVKTIAQEEAIYAVLCNPTELFAYSSDLYCPEFDLEANYYIYDFYWIG